MHVLLIEDHPDIRETLGMLLKMWGHQVEVAPDGGVGVQKGLAEQPEVAVVDIGLPVLDGFQVAKQLRSAFGKSIRLIALTAHADLEKRCLDSASGFDYFLAKPADLKELAHVLTSGDEGQR
jgi:two-component system, sensor histidine kinase